MHLAGYARHQESLKLAGFPLHRPARVQPVTRIEQTGETLAVPPGVSLDPEDLPGHLLSPKTAASIAYIQCRKRCLITSKKSRTPCSLSSMRQRNMLGLRINNDSINRPAPWRQQLDEIFIGVAEVNA